MTSSVIGAYKATMAGMEARREGKHIGDCPYAHGTAEGNAWRRGYIQTQSMQETVNGGYAKRHQEARQVLAVEALTPDEKRVTDLVAEVEQATAPKAKFGFDDFLDVQEFLRGIGANPIPPLSIGAPVAPPSSHSVTWDDIQAALNHIRSVQRTPPPLQWSTRHMADDEAIFYGGPEHGRRTRTKGNEINVAVHATSGHYTQMRYVRMAAPFRHVFAPQGTQVAQSRHFTTLQQHNDPDRVARIRERMKRDIEALGCIVGDPVFGPDFSCERDASSTRWSEGYVYRLTGLVLPEEHRSKPVQDPTFDRLAAMAGLSGWPWQRDALRSFLADPWLGSQSGAPTGVLNKTSPACSCGRDGMTRNEAFDERLKAVRAGRRVEAFVCKTTQKEPHHMQVWHTKEVAK